MVIERAFIASQYLSKLMQEHIDSNESVERCE